MHSALNFVPTHLPHRITQNSKLVKFRPKSLSAYSIEYLKTSMKTPLHPIPCPSGTPLIGNLLSLNAKAPLQSLMELTRELGPTYWLNMMGKPMIIASGPEIVKKLSDETRFDKSVRGPLRRVRSIGGDGQWRESWPARHCCS